MIDDPTDTLTTIEAKVLCMRYGLNDIDENNVVKTLRKEQVNLSDPNRSVSHIARQLGEDIDLVEDKELSALKKLKVTK